ncbi:MAG: ubiquinone biosynthesis protein UbiA [Chloroflexi bacterium RBG_19FT_COMBO_49_13]|nr:MAG: ubiquinone biosynthesis protein UbiA [Chloroflexi bacterium RBG_16_47_49]OGO62361.1 MAG: ubiquinone biosynthesis protein UbiA [Chloroflexi bacterium RBG_19FT_COMBO_49_13]
MNKSKGILGPMRVPFLILTPACVLLGIATAVRTGVQINPLHILWVLVSAICTHISVNAFNEYDDFKSGLDTHTQRTPFSGGSGTLPANPQMARIALTTALISLGVVILTGIFFTWQKGLAILPLGLLGVFVIVSYTPWLTRNPLLCLLAPGLGFGPLMVMGTHFALSGQYSWTAFVASLVPFFLVSNLLLLNQFPDVEADKTVGRRHFPILIGRKLSSFIFSSFLVLTYITILVGVLLTLLPPWSLLGMATLYLAIPLLKGSIKHAEDIQNLIPFMGKNVLVNLLTPVLVAIGIFIH